jgi:hypothetical protein
MAPKSSASAHEVNRVNPINRKPLLIIAIPIVCLLGSIPVSSATRHQATTVKRQHTNLYDTVGGSDTCYLSQLRANQTLARLTTQAKRGNGHVTITKDELKSLAQDVRAVCGR